MKIGGYRNNGLEGDLPAHKAFRLTVLFIRPRWLRVKVRPEEQKVRSLEEDNFSLLRSEKGRLTRLEGPFPFNGAAGPSAAFFQAQ